MVQENIKIVARIRPSSTAAEQTCVKCDAKTSTVTVENSKYVFDKTFDDDISQEKIFNDIASSIIDSFVGGFNGTIFAYGQTGSGKTYTMLGPDIENLGSENHGIIPRAIRRIFDILEAESQEKPNTFKYIFKCSFLQIYNEKLYDLLQNNKAGLTIQSSTKEITVKGAVEIKVKNFEECMNQVNIGLKQRRTAETKMNQKSSRSHAVLQLFMETKTGENGIVNKRTARLNLVDLAGSERQSQTGNLGEELREAANINKSLTTLGLVIRQVINREDNISYRDSKLTLLLRDSLGGNSKTTLLVNVHQNTQFVNQTVSTLRFAENVKKVKNSAKINESFSCEELVSCKADIGLLRQENGDLKSQVSTLCGEKSSLQIAVSKHEEKIENLEAQLGESKDEVKAAVKEIESKNNENEKLKKENDQLKNDAAAKIQELQDKIAELEQENDRLKCGSSNSNEQSFQDHDFDSGNDENSPIEGTFKWFSTYDLELKEMEWKKTLHRKPETYDVIIRESWNLKNQQKLSSGIEINFNGIKTFLNFAGRYNDGYLFVCGNCQQLYDPKGTKNTGKAFVFEGEDGNLDVGVLAHNESCVTKNYMNKIVKKLL